MEKINGIVVNGKFIKAVASDIISGCARCAFDFPKSTCHTQLLMPCRLFPGTCKFVYDENITNKINK